MRQIYFNQQDFLTWFVFCLCRLWRTVCRDKWLAVSFLQHHYDTTNSESCITYVLHLLLLFLHSDMCFKYNTQLYNYSLQYSLGITVKLIFCAVLRHNEQKITVQEKEPKAKCTRSIWDTAYRLWWAVNTNIAGWWQYLRQAAVLCKVGCVAAGNTNLFDLGSGQNGWRQGFQLGDSAPPSSMNKGTDFVDGQNITVPRTFITKIVFIISN